MHNMEMEWEDQQNLTPEEKKELKEKKKDFKKLKLGGQSIVQDSYVDEIGYGLNVIERKIPDKTRLTQEFRVEVKAFIESLVDAMKISVLPSKIDAMTQKIYTAEINNHERLQRPWSELKFNEGHKKNIAPYVEQKLGVRNNNL